MALRIYERQQQLALLEPQERERQLDEMFGPIIPQVDPQERIVLNLGGVQGTNKVQLVDPRASSWAVLGVMRDFFGTIINGEALTPEEIDGILNDANQFYGECSKPYQDQPGLKAQDPIPYGQLARDGFDFQAYISEEDTTHNQMRALIRQARAEPGNYGTVLVNPATSQAIGVFVHYTRGQEHCDLYLFDPTGRGLVKRVNALADFNRAMPGRCIAMALADQE